MQPATSMLRVPARASGLLGTEPLLRTDSVGQEVGMVALPVGLLGLEVVLALREVQELEDLAEELAEEDGDTALAVEEVTRELEGVGWTAEVCT